MLKNRGTGQLTRRLARQFACKNDVDCREEYNPFIPDLRLNHNHCSGRPRDYSVPTAFQPIRTDRFDQSGKSDRKSPIRFDLGFLKSVRSRFDSIWPSDRKVRFDLEVKSNRKQEIESDRIESNRWHLWSKLAKQSIRLGWQRQETLNNETGITTSEMNWLIENVVAWLDYFWYF